MFDGQTVLPLSVELELAVETVKPFEQRQLHGTVTIRPELEIPNQKVMQK